MAGERNPQYQRMGQAVANARVTRGWDQDTLAQRLGVKRQAVSQWENGRRWPQPLQRQALHRELGVSIPDEPSPMPAVARVPVTHGPGVRYACARIAQLVADLYAEVAEAERLAGLAAQDAEADALLTRLQTDAAAASPTPRARRRREG